MRIPVLVCAVAAIATACSGAGTPDQPSAGALSPIQADPSSLVFRLVGETSPLTASQTGQKSSCFGFQSPNTALATVTAATPNAGNGSAANTVVTAVSYGEGAIHVTCGVSTLEVPVVSWPNGRWSGDVEWQGGCTGSDAKYEEVVNFDIDATGKGTITVSDLSWFPRQYTVTIPSAPARLTFDSSGTFVYAPPIGSSVPVPAHLTITLDGQKVDYGETTNWGSCSNIYVGILNPSNPA
jgi:hypothetical protein